MIRAIYDDGITVWHASTGATQSKEENAALLAAVFAITEQMEYVDIKRHDIPGGIVQQHRLVGRFAGGKPLPDLYACLVITVKSGKIIGIEEYFDGSIYAEVFALAAAHMSAGLRHS